MATASPCTRRCRVALLLPAVLTLFAAAARAPLPPPAAAPPPVSAATAAVVSRVRFEENRGQLDPAVRYLARLPGAALFLTEHEAVMSVAAAAPARPAVLRMRVAGPSRPLQWRPADRLPGHVNSFRGRDRSRWRTQIPTYREVRARHAAPGVDLAWYGHPEHGKLEYDLVVHPGTSPTAAALEISGAEAARVEEDGSLALETPAGTVRQRRPEAYQEFDGERRPVPAEFVLTATAPREHRVAFRVASWDPTRPLVIDPVFVFSTYLGGGSFDGARSVAVGRDGSAYIAGATVSADFPRVGSIQGPAGENDAFVTRLDLLGDDILYSTYLGGQGFDAATDIALDSAGNAYVTGRTESDDFPTVNPAQANRGGLGDAFVAKLNPAGSALVYSTYLGGSGEENSNDVTFRSTGGIAVDPGGAAYLTGITSSVDFPVTQNPLQPQLGGGRDAFVVKLNAQGNARVYATYLGGSADENIFGGGRGIAVSQTGVAFVTGETQSENFPTRLSLQANLAGAGDAFITCLNQNGSALVFSTYYGGDSFESGEGIALDAAGAIYVSGQTSSSAGENFPLVNAFQPAFGGGTDAFVAKLTLGARLSIVYSSYLGGGAADEFGYDVAVHPETGVAVVAGATNSANFPRVDPLQPGFGGGRGDAFLTKVNAAGHSLVYSSHLGGSGDDSVFEGAAVALDADARACVVGVTTSANFPTHLPLQAQRRGPADAFVAKVTDQASLPAAPDRLTAVAPSSARVELVWRDNASNEDRYKVQRAVGAAGAFATIARVDPNAESFLDRQVQPGQQVRYRVRAENGDGGSAYVTTSSLTIPPPARLSIRPRRINFGNVRVGRRKSASITLRNRGLGPGLVEPELPPSPFRVSERLRLIVPRGRTVRLGVRFQPETRGPASVRLLLHVDGLARPVPITLTGRGR